MKGGRATLAGCNGGRAGKHVLMADGPDKRREAFVRADWRKYLGGRTGRREDFGGRTGGRLGEWKGGREDLGEEQADERAVGREGGQAGGRTWAANKRVGG